MTDTLGSGRRIPLAPREGWPTLGLVLLLCLSLAWSLDDAQLVLGEESLTDFLPWMAVGGVLAGFLGPTVGWGRWRTFSIGAIFAALVTPIIVGSVLVPGGDEIGRLFERTARSVLAALDDLVVQDRLTTTQTGHHLLIIGLLLWGSSMFASYAAFGHRRPLNGVVLIGFLLIGNMALTVREQLVYLVLYSLASLFLLIRFHTFDEQADWVRRRIGDPSALSGLYLRGGTIFIVSAVLGSLLLTSVAASAPLATVWTDMGGRLVEWTQFLQRYLPESGSGRSIGPSFGSTAVIRGVWTTNGDVALTWEAPPVEQAKPYLMAVIYDAFAIDHWEVSRAANVSRATDEDLLAATGDALRPEGRREMTMTVNPALARSVMFVPSMPARVNEATTLELIGADGYLARVTRSSSQATYTVTGLIPAEEADGGPTENQLRAAGQDYPAEIMDLYGVVPDGSITTPEARALIDEISARAGDNPYDIARTTVATLQDGARFDYDRDVRDLPCDDLSIVDCFAVHKQGYCEYYAATMAMILRELGIPTRVPYGFLPGERDLSSGVWTVRNDDAHSWVQVYFPGHGWIDFDPTGGGIAALPPLPSGRPEASGSARASGGASLGAIATPPNRDEPDGSSGGGAGGRGRIPVGSLIAVAILLVVVVGALAFVAWRRGPRGPVSADGAYGMVTRVATRFGFGPRPNQTVYEYAGALAEVLPDARPELETVARAKVEVAYGGRLLGADRLTALRDAQRRLRTSLLRLALRRDRRPGRRRGPGGHQVG